jgi:nitroreductase
VNREAIPDHPIHSLLVQRHSPYAFDPERRVAQADIDALFEAVRWTMSSYNAQPWRYIVGVRHDGTPTWERIRSCLLEGNQPWAQNAPVIALGLTQTHFDHNGKPNKAAEHDLGAASAFLTLEAVARGLCVHQMIGIDPDKVIDTFSPPEGLKPLTGLAIGYYGEPSDVPEQYAQRERNPRTRLPRAELLLNCITS